MSARVASAAEQRLPVSTAIGISRGGILLAFDEPLGFTTRDRLVISLELRDGQFQAIGNVRRVERGTDFRTYLAIEFSEVLVDDFDEVLRYLGRDNVRIETGDTSHTHRAEDCSGSHGDERTRDGR